MIINFKTIPEWQTLGRNGYSKACGISVQSLRHPASGEEIHLEPINSRGEVGRARLIIPRAHLAEFRDAINAIIAEPRSEESNV